MNEIQSENLDYEADPFYAADHEELVEADEEAGEDADDSATKPDLEEGNVEDCGPRATAYAPSHLPSMLTNNPHPPSELDQELLFRELITQHQRRLYRFVIKYIDHPDDAADITQQAFVEAARTIASFRGDSKLSTWLFGIAMNMVRNYQIARYTVTATVFSAIMKEMSDSLKGTANKIG